MKRGLAISAGSDVPQDFAWYADVRGFDPTVWKHSFKGIGPKTISSAILPLLLFRVGLVVKALLKSRQAILKLARPVWA